MQIVGSPPKKVMYKFLFFTCFWSGWEQLLAIQWWRCLKHLPESALAD